MNELPTETELVDEAWYSADGVRLAKYHNESGKFGIPGVGERSIDGPLFRFGIVAAYEPPSVEPMNLGAVVEDCEGRRFVRVGYDMPEGIAWYLTGNGMRHWKNVRQPITVLADGVPELQENR